LSNQINLRSLLGLPILELRPGGGTGSSEEQEKKTERDKEAAYVKCVTEKRLDALKDFRRDFGHAERKFHATLIASLATGSIAIIVAAAVSKSPWSIVAGGVVGAIGIAFAAYHFKNDVANLTDKFRDAVKRAARDCRRETGFLGRDPFGIPLP
jgi:hypothetical protein